MTSAERVALCRARRKAAAKCIDCGSKPKPDHARCRTCLRDRRESQEKYRNSLVDKSAELSDEVPCGR